MNILDRYLWRNALVGIAMAWFALILLDSFFSLISELDDTSDDNSYGTLEAILYIVYTLPARLYEYFPTSILVGALLGLGRLSANSEFTAMRAAGISIRQIALATLQLGVFLAIITFALGEWIVPTTDRYATNFKAVQLNNKVALTSDRGLWVKEKQEIIHIGKILSSQRLAEITVYRVSDNYQHLNELTTIQSAEFQNNQWTLHHVVTRTFNDSRVSKHNSEIIYTEAFINPNILKVTVTKPEQLTSNQLTQLIKHQERNGLSSDKYKLAFWKHFSTPLSALVMLMLAMPFLFTPQRSASVGQRLFIGIIVGVVFFLINNVLNEMGNVYSFPPLMSAFLPVLLFLLVSLIALRRVK